jgi:hypothetical protein
MFHQGKVLIPAGINEAWRGFWRHGTNFIEFWRDRSTILIRAVNLSPVTKLVAGSVAVQTISKPEICQSAGV